MTGGIPSLEPEPAGLDSVVEEPRPALCKRFGDGDSCRRRPVTEQAASAAGAADFGGGRAGSPGPCHQVIDRRRRDTWREPLAVVPLLGDLPSNLVPVAAC